MRAVACVLVSILAAALVGRRSVGPTEPFFLALATESMEGRLREQNFPFAPPGEIWERYPRFFEHPDPAAMEVRIETPELRWLMWEDGFDAVIIVGVFAGGHIEECEPRQIPDFPVPGGACGGGASGEESGAAAEA